MAQSVDQASQSLADPRRILPQIQKAVNDDSASLENVKKSMVVAYAQTTHRIADHACHLRKTPPQPEQIVRFLHERLASSLTLVFEPHIDFLMIDIGPGGPDDLSHFSARGRGTA